MKHFGWIFLLLSLWSVLPTLGLSGQNKPATQDTVSTEGAPIRPDSLLFGAYPAANNTGTWKDFPKLHPMIVHFPIVFLMLAFFAQILSFGVFKRELSYVTLFLIVLGFIGAYLSSGVFHGGDPDLTRLDAITRATFEKHEQYAGYTVWVSGIAALLKIISHFLFKRKPAIEILVMVLLAGSGYTIAVTGDMGARLVHIDGVGVQGNKIPAKDNM